MKVKVTFYMKSGNVITMKFKKIEISKLSGNDNREIVWEQPDKAFTIDVDQIECATLKNVLF